MNRLAIVTGYLGGIRDRFMVYREAAGLEVKLERAGRVEGADGVELLYPADFEDLEKLRELLRRNRLEVSSINFRSRRSGRWMRGSFSSASAAERREVGEELEHALKAALELGCGLVTTCPLTEGSDAPFELDYRRAYQDAAEVFRAACAAVPEVRLAIEYKLNEPRSRCLFGNAGEALSFCLLAESPNLGVTLDAGHALLAGERPAQSAALLAGAGRLFHVHLNDNDGRGDWDLIPGSFHFWDFLEFFYTLKRLGYDNSWYGYDINPKEADPVRHFTAVMKATRSLEALSERIEPAVMDELQVRRENGATLTYLLSLL
jgi:xylose isomerase